MPLYDYRCSSCGDFETWRTMAEVSTPMPCPECSDVAKRVFTAPNISLSSGSLATSVKGSSEPRLVKRQEVAPSKPTSQSVRGGRPWMIGHAPERL